MWLLARISVVLAALYARWRLRRRVVQPTGRQWGVAYTLVHERHGRSPHKTIGVPLESRIVFRIGRPDRWARWFDKLGLTPEMRTGQLELDSKFSIVADHRYFGQLLRKEKAIREALLRLEDAGAEAVYADGRVLWVRFQEPVDAEARFPELVALKRMLGALEKPIPSRFADWTIWKALALESVFYGLFAFAVISVALEYRSVRSVYLAPSELYFPAAMIGAFVSMAIVGITHLLTRKNARAEALRTEALALCVYLLPLGGYAFASHANRWLDRSVPVLASAEIAHKERSAADGKYYLHLKKTRAPASLDVAVPSRVEVSPGTFKRAKPGARVRFSLGRGRLGAEWIRAVRILASERPNAKPSSTAPPAPAPAPR